MKSTAAITFFAVSVLFMAGCTSLSPRNPDENIRKSLLELTPLGSSPQEVLAVIKDKELKLISYDETKGMSEYPGFSSRKMIGTSSISANLGSYYHFPIFRAYTNAYWAFDADKHLMEIKVIKDTDGP